MIALHFPETISEAKTNKNMQHLNISQTHSLREYPPNECPINLKPRNHSPNFIIQITPPHYNSHHSSSSSSSSSYSSMKLFNRFRKILMRILFAFPSSSKSKSSEMGGSKHERFEPPKTSCSSYYSSQSHYSEAIADCIDFFNKSNSQEEEPSDHVLV